VFVRVRVIVAVLVQVEVNVLVGGVMVPVWVNVQVGVEVLVIAVVFVAEGVLVEVELLPVEKVGLLIVLLQLEMTEIIKTKNKKAKINFINFIFLAPR